MGNGVRKRRVHERWLFENVESTILSHRSRKNCTEACEGENIVLVGLNRVSRYGEIGLVKPENELLTKRCVLIYIRMRWVAGMQMKYSIRRWVEKEGIALPSHPQRER